MTAHAPASDLLPVPAHGRRFTATRLVRLGDVDPHGSMRLDAVARHLQDIAADDAADSGLDRSYGWVVRRTLIVVDRSAVLAEQLRLTTFCTGTGRSWAERRTSITGDSGASIEACSLWIQIDVATGRPAALEATFDEQYGAAAGGRRVSSRLALPTAPSDAEARPWTVRATDLDVFDHVNNASQLAILEEVVADGPTGRVGRAGRAEIEYVAPIDARHHVELRVARDPTATGAWLVGTDGRTHTAARWLPA